MIFIINHDAVHNDYDDNSNNLHVTMTMTKSDGWWWWLQKRWFVVHVMTIQWQFGSHDNCNDHGCHGNNDKDYDVHYDNQW